METEELDVLDDLLKNHLPSLQDQETDRRLNVYFNL